MDITASLAPKSDQLDAVELVAPRTFTIEKVTPNNAEQPWNFHLAGFPRPWRPAKSMLLVIANAWGTDATQYAGRSVTLFCDPTVMFGNQAVGGVRISHMSHINGPLKTALLVKRGKSEIYTVQPLADAPPPRNWQAEADKIAGNEPKLKALWTEAQKNGASLDELNYIKEAATNG
ncbi:hypothetical protein [Arthrobacter woluwensis]|uniref:Uncharacterized protein n=1 Tax=Arthrobacter woluwensis TaxID=156980 RepID=A0A1H4WQX3_9MICC|nr:hypothetical protein [Arthrobacter woluwensis]SEC90205.1 hypothetical protein SAMN04489745_3466 [Arthrobacter woluwensis]SEC95450.1 hypothetical protein SAMN04489745_3538 [Arthrobacter woluwensis]